VKLTEDEKDILTLLLNSPFGRPENTGTIALGLFYAKHPTIRDNPRLGKPRPLQASRVSALLRRMERKGLLTWHTGFRWWVGPMVDHLKESGQLAQIDAPKKPEDDPWRWKGSTQNESKVWRFVRGD
jgi:hypothetical protein